jgi:hypothetical protein
VSNFLSSILLRKEPGLSVAPVALAHFGVTDPTLSGDLVVDGDAWLVDSNEPQVVRLFEVPDPEISQGLLIYRTSLKSQQLSGRAYLEMWCRLPGRGEFFSRGLNQTLSGTTAWSSFEVPFRLKKGQRPDLVKLNLVVEGRGKVWIRDVELLRMPR